MILLACLGLTSTLLAMEPPDPGAVDRHKADGTWPARLARAREIGNHRVNPQLAQRFLARLQRTAPDDGSVTPQSPLPAWSGMPTAGTNKVLVFLIDFPDQPHTNDATLIENKLFGSGTPAEFPQESLQKYYLRSSYGKLTLIGEAYGWYRMAHDRDWYTTEYGTGNRCNGKIIEEVVDHFDAAVDYSPYDNNGDGQVDYVAVLWSGPDTGWSGFWWGYQWSLIVPIVRDGVSFTDFSWQWESRPVGTAFTAQTIIHETGHALGLPDYYDYDEAQGPDGGVGWLDMMDGNWGDHNGFSKTMLDWITPAIVSSGSVVRTLPALAQTPEAVTVMPGLSAGSVPYSEYFLVENRHRVANDTGLPSDGLLVWHVDATPNAAGTDFAYDNSYAEHKLLRLMEADGLEEIETGDGEADAGDYYNQGDQFTPSSTPNSYSYAGADTGVRLTGISADGPTMTATVSVGALSTALACTPAAIARTAPQGGSVGPEAFQVWSVDGSLNYTVSNTATWLSVAPTTGSTSGGHISHTLTYATATLPAGVHLATIQITSADAANSPLTITVAVMITAGTVADAVDAPQLNWRSGGEAPWFWQSAATVDHVDAARSGACSDAGTSWVETTLQGPGQLAFWWSVSSEPDRDGLRFLLDGAPATDLASGNVAWQRLEVEIPAGVHTGRWTYAKDGSGSAGTDAGWLDLVAYRAESQPPVLAVAPAALTLATLQGQNVPAQQTDLWNSGGGQVVCNLTANRSWLTVTPAVASSAGSVTPLTLTFATTSLAAGNYTAAVTVDDPNAANAPIIIAVDLTVQGARASLAEALDAPDLIWLSGGGAPWFPQGATSHDNSDAARSGAIGDATNSWLATTIIGPGTLDFWWAIASETNRDTLEVTLNGTPLAGPLSGNSGWQQPSFALGTGAQTLRWDYAKDASRGEDEDAAWLDQVSFAPTAANTLPNALDNYSIPWSTSGNANWYYQTALSYDGADAARSGAISRNQSSDLTTTLTGPGTLCFRWKTECQVLDSLQFLVDGVSQPFSLQGTRPWRFVSTTIPAGTHTCVWRLQDNSFLSSSAYGLVDRVRYDPATPGTLAEALEIEALPLTTDGDSLWGWQSAETHDGADAAQTGVFQHNQQSHLRTTVQGPGELAFWWQVSSETKDRLSLWLDEVEVAGIGGETTWALYTRDVGAGPHTLRWTYAKDATDHGGSDYAWVDQLSFLPLAMDADGDGIDDGWEFGYVGNLSAMTATSDSDADGFTDVQEAAADSNPTNAASYLHFEAVAPQSDGAVALQWQGATGKHYHVERTSALVGGFGVIQSNVPGAVTTTWTDRAAPTNTPAFYRVRLRAQ